MRVVGLMRPQFLNLLPFFVLGRTFFKKQPRSRLYLLYREYLILGYNTTATLPPCNSGDHKTREASPSSIIQSLPRGRDPTIAGIEDSRLCTPRNPKQTSSSRLLWSLLVSFLCVLIVCACFEVVSHIPATIAATSHRFYGGSGWLCASYCLNANLWLAFTLFELLVD